MSSDDDVPAPSPSAAVLARRASREAKSMREESGSEEDSNEPVEWEDDDEASSEEDEDEVRVSNAQRGRVRLHGTEQSSTGLEVDDDRRKSLGEKGWARRSVVVRSVGPSGAADFEAVPGREEYGAGEDGAAEWEKTMLEFAEDNFNDAGIELRSMDQRDLQVGSSVTSWTAWAMAVCGVAGR